MKTRFYIYRMLTTAFLCLGLIPYQMAFGFIMYFAIIAICTVLSELFWIEAYKVAHEADVIERAKQNTKILLSKDNRFITDRL